MTSRRKRGGSRPTDINTTSSKTVRFEESENNKQDVSTRFSPRPPTPRAFGPQSTRSSSRGFTSRRSTLRSQSSNAWEKVESEKNAAQAAAQVAAQVAADQLHYETEKSQQARHGYQRPTVEDENDNAPITTENNYQSPTYIDSSIPPSEGAGNAQQFDPFYTQKTPSIQTGVNTGLAQRQQDSSPHHPISAKNFFIPQPATPFTSNKNATTASVSGQTGPQNSPPPVQLSQQGSSSAPYRLSTKSQRKLLAFSNGLGGSETTRDIFMDEYKNHPPTGGRVPPPAPESPARPRLEHGTVDLRKTSGKIKITSVPPVRDIFQEGTILTKHHYNGTQQRKQLLKAACNPEMLKVTQNAVSTRISKSPDTTINSPVIQLLKGNLTSRDVAKAQRNREKWKRAKKTKRDTAKKAAKNKMGASLWSRLYSKLAEKVPKLTSRPTGGDPPDDPDWSDSSDDDVKNSNGKRPRSAHDETHARRKRSRKALEKATLSADTFIFPRHPTEGYSDQAYDVAFYQLYNKLYEFVKKYFGPQYNLQYLLQPGTNEKRDTANLWKIRLWESLPTELINWLEIVADGDPGGKSGKDWSSLFLDSIERTAIICAIISKIIEVKVFGELLFGADELELSTLESAEKSLALNEGFTRTEVRSKTVCAMMGPYSLTVNFDSKVEELSRQLFVLLSPLNNWLAEVPLPEDTERPQIQEGSQFKELKAIIKGAGFVSLMVRRSPNIFHFVSATPGSYYDKEDHFSINGPFYNTSKKMITEQCEEARKRYVKWGQTATREEIKALPYVKPQTRAMVKVGITPTIRIYKPGRSPASEASREENLPGEDGFHIFLLRQAAILCQLGVTNFEKYEHRPKQNLRDYINHLKYLSGMKPPTFWRSRALLATSVATAATAASLFYLSRNHEWSSYSSPLSMVSENPTLSNSSSAAQRQGIITTQLAIPGSAITSTPSMIKILEATYTLIQ